MTRQIAIIGTNGYQNKYGGFETFVDNYVPRSNLKNLFVIYNSGTKFKIEKQGDVCVRTIPFKANGWQSVLYDCYSIVESILKKRDMLILGSSGALMIPVARFFGRKIVTNVGGIDWKRQKWSRKTQFILKLFEYICVKFSSTIIADNEFVSRVYRKLYGRRPKTIPYGGNHVHLNCTECCEISRGLPEKFGLSVARAQRDNNIHHILSLYTNLPNHNLVIISNWKSSTYGVELYEQYANKYENIWLIQAIYDQKLLDNIRIRAAYYIHTHSACGTAPSLVEIMWMGVPVIAYDCAANRSSTFNDAFYYKDPEQLCEKITQDNDMLSNGKKMKVHALREYTWEKITETYDKILLGHEK